jgi:tRNA 2-thiouridine synthesizing protein E
MTISTDPILGRTEPPDPRFPHAPAGWTFEEALRIAHKEGLEPAEDHWEVVRSLQAFYARHEEADLPVKLPELHDALEEKFHHKGGFRYLYTLLPGGPIAQGCRLAGLKPPGGAVDTSFGSVA